jgi:hypothetical protein
MHCVKHQFEHPVAVCAGCGELWCRPCVTFPGGEGATAWCTGCALVRAGVRPGKVKPLGRRELRRKAEALRAYLATAGPAFEALPLLDLEAVEAGSFFAGPGSEVADPI